MISREELLKGETLPLHLEQNLTTLLERLNNFRDLYGKPMIVTSGYRTEAHNYKIGGAPYSKHCQAMACDFFDFDGKIKLWIKNNTQVLVDCDLYMEDPIKTPTWVHLDIFKRKTRVFKV